MPSHSSHKELLRRGMPWAGLVLLLALAPTAWADDFKLGGSCLVFDYDTNFPAGSTHSSSYRWTGACDAEGYATGPGTLQAFWDGRLDEASVGTLVRGHIEGHAVTTTPQGGRFEGAYREGRRTGYGVATWIGKAGLVMRYEGGFVDGQADGYGVETHGNGWRYEGEFVHGRRDGHGIETGLTPPGIRYRYEGDFAAGSWSGQGRVQWSTGDRYMGNFKQGKCDGYGTWTWVSGKEYHGLFVQGRPQRQDPLASAGGGVAMAGFPADIPTLPENDF